MKIIIKSKICFECGKNGCEHSKPVSNATKGKFPKWQERTCSIKEFNEQFGKTEGMWDSKGTNHHEILCDNDGCGWYKKGGHKHCRRRMEDEYFWYMNFKSIKEFEEFIEDVGFAKVYVEDQDGVGITMDLN